MIAGQDEAMRAAFEKLWEPRKLNQPCLDALWNEGEGERFRWTWQAALTHSQRVPEAKHTGSLRGIWGMMMARCYEPQNAKYSRYGGRGIKVCDRWLCFRLFSQDMSPRPKGGTIDRINNDGPYAPENCRWATLTEQANNRSDTNIISFNGRTQSRPDWARELGLLPDTLKRRLQHGWPLERALTEKKSGRYA